jgi:hypothetical protein
MSEIVFFGETVMDFPNLRCVLRLAFAWLFARRRRELGLAVGTNRLGILSFGNLYLKRLRK